MVDLVGEYDTDASPADDRSPLPAGQYVARIIDASRDPVSKTKDCGDALVLTWKVEGGEYDGRLVWQRINMWFTGNNAEKVREIGNRQFAAIREATGVLTPRSTDELLERPCLLTVKVRQDPGYNPSNEVSAVKSVGGGGVPANRGPAPVGSTPRSAPADVGGAPKANPFQRAKAAGAR